MPFHIAHTRIARLSLALLTCSVPFAYAQVDAVPPGGPLKSGLGYDANGNLTTVNLPQGTGQTDARKETHLYDSLDRRYSSTLAAPSASASAPVILVDHDGLDQVRKVTDPRKNATTYTTNGLGNTTARTSPDSGQVTGIQYYPDGLLQTWTDPRGKVFTYTYDDIGRLTKVTYSTGVASGYTYDGGKPKTPNNSTGQLSQLTDESGTTSYTHDGLGRVISKTQLVKTASASQTFKLTQTWDTATVGQLATQTYPSSARLNYTYDTNGRIQSITLNPVKASGSGTNTAQTLTLLSGIQYNALGAVRGWTWGAAGGVAYSRTFDTQGRLSSYPLGNPATDGLIRTLGYDDAGRISGYSHTTGAGVAQPNFDQSFGYDGLDRLTQNTQDSTSYGYGYDLANNRVSQTLGGKTYQNTIPATNNQLKTERLPGGVTSFSYDEAGNLKSDGTNTFTYSDRGRLASVLTPKGTVSYLYNAIEQRLVKSGPTTVVEGGARYYVYDEQGGHLIGEYQADGTPAYEVVYLGDTPVAVITQDRSIPGTVKTVLSDIYADHLDTPRVITQAADQAIRWRWDQAEAFGSTGPNEKPGNPPLFSFNLRFPGQVYDRETLLVYNLNRDYRPQSGRYTESDPIGLKGGINTYAYVGGNPLSIADPTGENPALLAIVWLSEATGISVEALVTGGLVTADVAAGIATGSQSPSVVPASGAIRTAEQYSLRALESGFYPVLKRGIKGPASVTWCERGDVWKYGKTINPKTRYSESYLKNIGKHGVEYITEFTSPSGTEALTEELRKILEYMSQNGVRPPGNKVNR